MTFFFFFKHMSSLIVNNFCQRFGWVGFINRILFFAILYHHTFFFFITLLLDFSTQSGGRSSHFKNPRSIAQALTCLLAWKALQTAVTMFLILFILKCPVSSQLIFPSVTYRVSNFCCTEESNSFDDFLMNIFKERTSSRFGL